MLNKSFTATLQKGKNKGAWTYVVWPESSEFFGTHGPVKIRGTVDGYPIESSFMSMGGGVHMLPVKADIRTAIKKDVGDVVTVVVQERLEI